MLELSGLAVLKTGIESVVYGMEYWVDSHHTHLYLHIYAYLIIRQS